MPVAAEKKELTSEVLQEAAGLAMDAEYYGAPAAKVPPPEVFTQKRMETAVLFDWDDTLLPSTLLATKGYRLDGAFDRCPETEASLRLLERAVCTLLSTAARHGKVHIVTNAEHGWVQLSAQRFMPAVLPFLDIATVISARSTYEGFYPGQPLQWKVAAMQERLRETFEEAASVKNVLSFGDSHVEREAVKIASSGRANARVKSIKLAERPSVEQLRRQLELVSSCFSNLHSYDGDLDLMLQVTPTAADGTVATPTAACAGPTSAVDSAVVTPSEMQVVQPLPQSVQC